MTSSYTGWNSNQEEDARYNLKWNRVTMRFLGIWCLVSDVSLSEKLAAVVLAVLSFSSLGFGVVTVGMFVFGGGNNADNEIEMLGPLGYMIMSMCKYLCLVFRCKEIRRCMRTLRNDWRSVQGPENRDIMLEYARRGHILSKICSVFIYTGGAFYHTAMPLFIQANSRSANNSYPPLPYKGYEYLMVDDSSLSYLLVTLLQIFCGCSMFHITVTVCSLAAVFVNHTCGQLEILMSDLRAIGKAETKELIDFNERLRKIIRHHVDTLRFSKQTEQILREILLVEIVGSTLIICLLEYYCIVKWSSEDDNVALMTYLLLLSSFTFNVVMYCCIGELLTEQCIKVGQICYNSVWYKVPRRSALDFKLIVFISQHPPRLTAGKIIKLSLITCTKVLKTSVAYLNIMRTFVQ